MITNPTPITQPATTEKVFDKLHVYSINAIQPTPTSGLVVVELIPATNEGELAGADSVQRVSVPLYPAMNEVPELAAAFAAILSAIPAVIAWQATQTD